MSGSRFWLGVMAVKARNFEDLAVYQKARALVKEVYQITRTGSFAHDEGLCDQIRRASISIVSNIAEGYERGSNTELIQFLYIAKGSCGEVRAQLMIACDLGYLPCQKYDVLSGEARRISAMLSNLIRYVKSSGYVGPKRKSASKPEPSEFQKLMDNYIPPPLRTQTAPPS